MLKQIIYRPNYISIQDVNEIRSYFNNINDSLLASHGPYSNPRNKLGWQGAWDRQLHWEKSDNPIHKLSDRLKQDFGSFEVYDSSIRYLAGPYLPHSDVRSVEWVENLKKQKKKEGFTFLIPLWWDNDYHPGTAFFNSPPNLDELLYSERLDVLPHFSDEYKSDMRNFSVRDIIKWNTPGDLVAWENFQFHASCHHGDAVYDRNKHCKEFLSFETHSTN